MKKFHWRMWPDSLVGRVYLLYTATLLLFVGLTFSLFYQYQYRALIDEAQDSATILIEVVSQAVTDSAVIGDYDTIQRTLNKSILGSRFKSAKFIDLTGGVIESVNSEVQRSSAPQRLREKVAEALYDVNRNISIGGVDYGVLRLAFDADSVAQNFWNLTKTAMLLGCVGLFGGLLLIWFPLKRWLGALERVAQFNRSVERDGKGEMDLLTRDVPSEFQPAFEVLRLTAQKLRTELDARDQVLLLLRQIIASLLPVSVLNKEQDSDDITALSKVIATMVAEREASRAELESAKELAESASRAKSEFLANMSHEIRTPLNGIIGMTDLVLDSELSASQRDFLQIVRESARTLLSIVNEILDFSKIEAGMLMLESVPVDIRHTVESVVMLHQHKAVSKSLSLVFSIDENVPRRTLGDSVRLVQVLNNLIGNAIKFTNHGEVAVRVHYTGLVPEETCSLVFEVADTGIGIPPDKVDSVFLAFEQADSSTTRNYGGTGLGLAISRRLISLMGGHIEVTSTVGKGSVFRFELPCIPTQQGEQLPLREPTTALPLPAIALARRVLVVEDNAVNQRLVSVLLERHGYECTLSGNGQEALDLLRDAHFDAVLMDMQMPVMSGIEATQKIRNMEARQTPSPHVPIVAMTANVMPNDRELCMQAGMDDYISKPINAAQLFATLERLISESQ